MVRKSRIFLILFLVLAWVTSWAQATYNKKALTESLASDVWLNDWKEARFDLEHGADPNTKLQDETPVLYECIRSNPEFAKELIEHGADPNAVDAYGQQVICEAAGFSLELTKMLVDRGANLKVKDNDGYSPFTYAVMADRSDVVAFFLKNGFSVDERSDIGDKYNGQQGVTPLMIGAKHSSVASMKVLLDAGADPEAVSKDGATPLAYALSGYAMVGNRQGKDKDAQRLKINTAIGLLIDRGAPVDQRTAARFFSPSSSYDPLAYIGGTTKQDRSFTPLMIASAYQWYGAMQVLLDRKADPNLKSERGIPPILWVCTSNADGPVKLLIKAGADINIEGNLPGFLRNKGITPLLVAASAGAEKVVEDLLEAGADPNRMSTDGIPTIAFSWIHRDMNPSEKVSNHIAKMLLDAGADINGGPSIQHPERPWITPIQAIGGGYGDMCSGTHWLLDHGADPMKASSNGHSVCDKFAIYKSHPDIINRMPDCIVRLFNLCK